MASCLAGAVQRDAWSPQGSAPQMCGRQHGYRLQDLNISTDWLPGRGEDQQAVADAAGTGSMEGRLNVLEGQLTVLWMYLLHRFDASLLCPMAGQVLSFAVAASQGPARVEGVTCPVTRSLMVQQIQLACCCSC